MTTTTAPRLTRRNVALRIARTYAGVLGVLKLAGMGYFLLVVPEEALWLGLWIDVPVVAGLLAIALLQLAVALAPRVSPARRISLGFAAVGLDVAVTLVKVTLYDEPESATVLGLAAILLALLLLARRGERG